jgi:hypothetical protein
LLILSFLYFQRHRAALRRNREGGIGNSKRSGHSDDYEGRMFSAPLHGGFEPSSTDIA